MSVDVYLHGSLRDPDHPGPYRLAVSTVAKALELLSLQVRTLRPDRHGRKRVKVAGIETSVQVHRPLAEGEEVHVVPALCGGKSSSASGIIQTVIGAVLVIAGAVAGFGFGQVQLGIGLAMSGVTMILGGVLQLMNQPPKTSPESNVYLGSPQNTVAIGTPVQILCGRRLIGGQMLTYHLSAGAYVTADGYSTDPNTYNNYYNS